MNKYNIKILLATLLGMLLCLEQTSAQSIDADSEKFTSLTDSIVKREVSFFTIKGASLGKTDPLSRTTLIEIPIRNCSEKEVHLSRSTFTSSVSIFIDLYFKGEAPAKMLDSVCVVTHSHFWVKIPPNAFQGLLQPNPCNLSSSGKGKKANLFSQHYKAFHSLDKKRLYIYMQGGVESSRYEVTWVIINDKYYTRVLDYIL